MSSVSRAGASTIVASYLGAWAAAGAAPRASAKVCVVGAWTRKVVTVENVRLRLGDINPGADDEHPVRLIR